MPQFLPLPPSYLMTSAEPPYRATLSTPPTRPLDDVAVVVYTASKSIEVARVASERAERKLTISAGNNSRK